MRRRAFVAAVAAALAAPRGAGAKQSARPRVGYLAPNEPPRPFFHSFRDGLRDLGYVDGQNVTLVYRSGEGQFENLRELAEQLVRQNVDVIVTGGTEGVAAVKQVTQTIPIVMRVAADPVASGFVASLARPGRNITGLSAGESDHLWGKRLALLKDAAPKATRIAVLWNPPQSYHRHVVQGLSKTAAAVRVQILPVAVTTGAELESALGGMEKARADAVMVPGSTLHLRHLERIAAALLRQRLPAISFFRQFPELGGLMSYSVDEWDLARRAATYVDKILKGAKPGDLPVEQPTKFDLIINGKTAKALGLTIPRSLLLRAAQVIE